METAIAHGIAMAERIMRKMVRYVRIESELARIEDHLYGVHNVYKVCQIVIREAVQLWAYIVILEDEHYELYPPRAFDNERRL
jgi:hypothetical protein